MKPKRIQRKRTKGWKMPENAVYVGRPTKWGNPYKVIRMGDTDYRIYSTETGFAASSHKVRIEALNDCVLFYKNTLEYFCATNPKLLPPLLNALRGKDLACWCPLDQPCHADVLLEIANS